MKLLDIMQKVFRYTSIKNYSKLTKAEPSYVHLPCLLGHSDSLKLFKKILLCGFLMVQACLLIVLIYV